MHIIYTYRPQEYIEKLSHMLADGRLVAVECWWCSEREKKRERERESGGSCGVVAVVLSQLPLYLLPVSVRPAYRSSAQQKNGTLR